MQFRDWVSMFLNIRTLKNSVPKEVKESKKEKTETDKIPAVELKILAQQTISDLSCSLDNPDDCLACGS